jgi:hypothetical protein
MCHNMPLTGLQTYEYYILKTYKVISHDWACWCYGQETWLRIFLRLIKHYDVKAYETVKV